MTKRKKKLDRARKKANAKGSFSIINCQKERDRVFEEEEDDEEERMV